MKQQQLKTEPKIKKCSVWQYWLPVLTVLLTSKAILCFSKGLKFLRTKKNDFVRGISKMFESDEWRICDERGEFGWTKLCKRNPEPDKLDWIHVDVP